MSKNGWDEVSRTFHWLASRFSNCTTQSFDLVAEASAGTCLPIGSRDYRRCCAKNGAASSGWANVLKEPLTPEGTGPAGPAPQSTDYPASN
jgi:hypothetical protein